MNSELREWWFTYSPFSKDDAESEEVLLLLSRYFDDHQKLPDKNTIKDFCDRLKLNEPIQYILGESWFYGRKYEVNSNTLIPRPETEELCHFVLKEMNEISGIFLDAGTGSGCVAVTLAAEKPMWKGIAVDIFDDTIETAKRNATLNRVEFQIEFFKQDLLNWANPPDNLKLIVSNPPYIGIDEKTDIDSRVLDWEPHQALFPFHQDPLIFYKKIKTLLQRQHDDCILWAEINPKYAEEIKHLFPDCNIVFDMYGKARFVRAQKEKGAV